MIPINFKFRDYTIKEVTELSELIDLFHLRHQIYCERMGLAVSSKKLNESELDFISSNDSTKRSYEFDEHDNVYDWTKGTKPIKTIHIIAKKEDDIVGTVRIVHDSEKGLPMESDFSLKGFRKNGVIPTEISRLMNVENVVAGLFRAITQYSISESVNRPDLFITSQKEMERLYKKIAFESIGEPFLYSSLGGFWTPMHMNLIELSRRYKNEKGLSVKVIDYMFTPL